DALRQQVMKSADVKLLAIQCVELARDLYAIPHDLYVLIKRVLGQQYVDFPPREQRLRSSRVGGCYVEPLPRAEHFEEFEGRNWREHVRQCSQHRFPLHACVRYHVCSLK